MCRSKALEVHEIYAVNPEFKMVILTPRKDYNEGNLGSNIASAAFTASFARLKLVSMKDNLGERLRYFDTNSVVFPQSQGNGSHRSETFWEIGTISLKSRSRTLYDLCPAVHKCIVMRQTLEELR